MKEPLRPVVAAGQLTNEALATFSATIARGAAQRLSASDYLEFAAHIVTWAVASTAVRAEWGPLRQRINDTLGPAVAAALDVAYGYPGHACVVDIRPPYEPGTQ